MSRNAPIPKGLDRHTQQGKHHDDSEAQGTDDNKTDCCGSLHSWCWEDSSALQQNRDFDQDQREIVSENAGIKRLMFVSVDFTMSYCGLLPGNKAQRFLAERPKYVYPFHISPL